MSASTIATPSGKPAARPAKTASRSSAPIQAPPRRTSPACVEGRRPGGSAGRSTSVEDQRGERPAADDGEQPRRAATRTVVATRPSTSSSATAATTAAAASSRPARPAARSGGRRGSSRGRQRPGRTPSRASTSWVVLSAFIGLRRASQQAAGEVGDQLAGPPALDDAGRLGALADRRLGDAEPLRGLVVRRPGVDQVGHLPAPRRAPVQDRGPQPERGLEGRAAGVVAARPAGARALDLAAGDRLAGVQVGRAAAGPGALGERLLDLADADADVPAVRRAAAARRTAASAAGSSRTPWNSSPAVRSKARSSPTSASAARVAGTRSVAAPGWSRAGRR